MDKKNEKLDPPYIFVPEFMQKKLTYQEKQLCWHINNDKRLSEDVRQEVLKLLDTYVKARERLKANREDPQTVQSQNRKVGTVPRSEIEMVRTKAGKLVPRPKAKVHQREPSDENQNSDLDKLPLLEEDLELAAKQWNEIPDNAFRNIVDTINSKIQQMEFYFSFPADPNSDTERRRFNLGPKAIEKSPDLLIYWYLSIFLSGDHVDWLRGRCSHCKRFIINSDPRVKYCNPDHKDLYWRPRRREYHRQKMADRRKG